MKKNIRTILLGLFITFAFSNAVYGQDFWVKKSYEKWTLSEVTKVLTDSPWAQNSYELYGTVPSMPRTAYSAIVRLHSALPVRQAIVRKMRLTIDYEKLDPTQKKNFDEEVNGLLSCDDCSKYYVVNLILPVTSNMPSRNKIIDEGTFGSNGVEMRKELMKLKPEELQKYISLSNDKGESRTLYQAVFPKGKASEVLLIFKRNDDNNKPLITRDNEKFYFRIDEKAFGRSGWPFRRFTFEVSKILQNNEILF